MLAKLGCEDSSRQVSQEYSVWGRAMEIQRFTAMGGNVASEAFKEVCGRTQAPTFRQVPVRPNNRTTPMSRLAPAGLDTLTAWLATIFAMINKVEGQVRKGNAVNVKEWQRHLVSTVGYPTNGLVREWSTTHRSTDIYAVWLAVVRAASPTVKGLTLAIAKATVTRVMKATADRQRELARHQWDRKVAKMVEGAMGDAHRWANAPNRGVFTLDAPGAHSLSAVVNWHAGEWSKVCRADKL